MNSSKLTTSGCTQGEDVFRFYQNTQEDKGDRFYLLFQCMPRGAAIYRVINAGRSGKDYIIQDINEAALKTEGKRLGEVRGKSLSDLWPDIDHYGLIPVFRKVWETGEPATYLNNPYIENQYHNGYESRVFKLPTGEIVAIFDDAAEKRLIHRKPKESEQRYHQITEAISDVVWMTDLELHLTYISPSVQKIFGETAQAHMAKTLDELFPPQSYSQISVIFQEEMTAERSAQSDKRRTRMIELQQYKADGSMIWIAMNISFLRDAQGNAVGLLGVSRDISERKRAEQALAHSHALMQYIIEHNRSSVAVYDKELRYLYVSQRYLDGYRVREKDIIGKHHCEIFPDLPQKWRDMHLRALKGEVIFAEDDTYVHADGAVEWTRWECRPWYEQDGSIGGIVVYTEMITDRKKAELALQKSEKLYQTFINTSSDLIYLKDDQMRYMMVNEAFADFLGASCKDIVGQNDDALMSKGNARVFRQSDLQAIRHSGGVIREEMIGKKWIESIRFPVHIEEGRTGVGAYIRDITDKKEQQENIRRTIERHTVLLEVFLRSFSSRQEQLDYGLREALLLTGSRYGYIYLYDEDSREFTINSWTEGVLDDYRITEKQTRYFLDRTGIWGEVVRQRKPIVVNDFSAPNPLKKGFPKGHVQLKNFMSIPIFNADRIVAVLGLANKNEDYDDDDVFEMTMLMNGIWMAVEQKESQRQVENLLAQTRSMFNEHEAVMLLIKPDTGAIIDANPAALYYYGYTKDELCAMSISDINTLPRDEVMRLINDIMERKRNCITSSHRMKNGASRMVDVYSSPISYNSSTVLYAIIFDVTEREKAFDNIRYINFHDYLTGLYNRRYFDNALAEMDTEACMPLTVIMADINGLKLVNDSFGHEEGDRLLMEAANTIRKGCGGNDIVARIGGDEFAIILPNTDEQQAQQVMKSIKTLEEHTKLEPLVMSLSMGYAVRENSAADMAKTLAEAENYMYRHKMYESASMRSKTIEIIMNTLFEKSSREMEHSKRVGKISAAIAAASGLDSGDVNQARTAGTLHDIGKIGISEKILNKPDRLTGLEWQELKKHAEAGWRILSNSDEFSEVANFIRHHHERWDGQGYPEGLAGEMIPLQSRIIAVADAYDAMTQDRPYRKSMSKQQAIIELERNSGVQFDPEVVGTFIEKVCPLSE